MSDSDLIHSFIMRHLTDVGLIAEILWNFRLKQEQVVRLEQRFSTIFEPRHMVYILKFTGHTYHIPSKKDQHSS